jgi:uncharacterized protein YfaS (alpha-2-macroglobulin family)
VSYSRLVLVASLVLLWLSCSDKKKDAATPAPALTQRGDGRALEPLPTPPPFDVAVENLAGAADELTVVAARPQGDFAGEIRPTATFSRPVKALEMVEAQRAGDAEKPFADIEPALEGEWRWLGSASAEFVPKGLVPHSTTFTVSVRGGLKALDGSTLREPYVFSFSTPRLNLQEVAPMVGSRWVKPDDALVLLFNQPVKKDDLEKSIELVAGGKAVPFNVVKGISIQDERRAEIEAAKKAGRAYDDLRDDERGYRNRQMRYTLKPDAALPLDADVSLRIDSGLHGAQGPLAIRPPSVQPSWRTYGPLKFTRVHMCHDGDSACSYGPLVLETSNEVDVSTLKERLTITPPVDLEWDSVVATTPSTQYELERQPPRVVLPGRFKPGTKYQVTIAAGVQDVFKQSDATGISGVARTADLSPNMIGGADLAFIEAVGASPKLPLEVANLKTLNVRMWKLTPEELVQAIAHTTYENRNFPARAADFQEDEKLKYAKNHARVHGIEMKKVLGEPALGAAVVVVTSPDIPAVHRAESRQLVQVSDLAAHLKLGPKSSLVWVTRLSTAEPVAEADVSLHDESGAAVWSGKTNAEGFADAPGAVDAKLRPPKNRWEFPFAAVLAKKDGDMSATANSWARGIEAYEFGLSQGWEGEHPEATSFAFSDRGIYRPGDEIFVKGIVRYRVLGQLRAPPEGTEFAVKVIDSRSEPVSELKVKTTKYGTFSFSTKTTKDAATGFYSAVATATLDGGDVEVEARFRVEEYRAPQFRVDVAAKKDSVIAPENLEAHVSASYLFGGAMSDTPVKWSVHRGTTTFTSEAWAGFTFAQETWWWDDHQSQPWNSFVASGEARTDAKGGLDVKNITTEAIGERPFTYTLEAEATDVNRQAVAGRVEITVHPASTYVGLKANTYFMQVGTEYPFDTVVVDPQGKAVAGRTVDVTITSRTWKSVKKKDATGGFTTLSEPVEQEVAKCQVKSAEASVPCAFKPAAAGFFIVRAQVKDDRNRVHASSLGVYATGSEFVAWQRSDTDRVEVLTDKTLYDVGDVAKVLIKSPYPQARAMVTVEREGVLSRRLVNLKGSVVTVEVPITEEMVPNVFAGVLIMRPRVAEGGVETGDDPGRPNARVGLVKLNVERKSRRLTVAVKADKKDYRPRDRVTVDVAAKDFEGKPAAGEVTLFVVDEAVLRLTAYTTPDPIQSIYPDRPLSIRMGEPLLHLVRRRQYGEKGEAQGGGGGSGEGGGIRNQFKTTVIFNPTLELKNGAAQASFTLPDNLTSFRVMAVVVTQADRFGSGETAFQVNKPIMALPAMPRFARVGDVFEAGVVVHRHEPGSGEVVVTAAAKGGVQLEGAAERRESIADGAPKEVRFTFKATAPGKVAFRFTAKSGASQDGVEETINIESPAEVDAVATYGDTTDSRVEAVAPPKDALPELGGLTVSLASTSLGGFSSGFQQLIDYPYGCLEQQSSRLVPFIALREIAGQFGVPWPSADKKKQDQHNAMNVWLNRILGSSLDASSESNPDAVVEQTVKSIQALQDGDGSFRYWPSAWCSNSWASAYATLALARAREVGFSVSQTKLSAAEAYLTKVVGGHCNACERGCDDETRVFAAYVLARAKRPVRSAYTELLGRAEKLPLFSRALLANAMFIGGGDKKKANALLQSILNHAKESPKGVHLEEVNAATGATYFHSDTRTTGVVLQALTDISPQHPFVGKMAKYLTGVRRGNGEWRSTQEAAFSLMALTQVLRTKEKDTPDMTASVVLGAAPLFEQAFKGRSMEVVEKSMPMRELLTKTGGAQQTLTFKKEGAGVLYYSALLKYAPKDMPTKSLDSGLFVQRWFEPYLGGGQSTKFFAGELVRIRVRVATRQERHWVAFEVPLPAGLEPVDTSLATTARGTRGPDEESRRAETEWEGQEDGEEGSAAGDDSDGPWAGRFWSPFNHTEMRDNRVVIFADHLPPGVNVTSFVARATTPGSFILKPAKGTLMYEPEVWGRSEGGRFEVALPTSVSAK